MISILSGIVLMVVMGSIIQKSGSIARYFADEESAQAIFVTDEVAVSPNMLTRIEVLENDTGLADEDWARLRVSDQPSCGRVFVQNGALQYLPGSDCQGRQIIRYTLDGEAGGKFGEVIAMVGAGEPRGPRADVTSVAQAPRLGVAPAQDNGGVADQDGVADEALSDGLGDGLALAAPDPLRGKPDPTERLAGARRPVPVGPPADLDADEATTDMEPTVAPAPSLPDPVAEPRFRIENGVEVYGDATGEVPRPSARPDLTPGEIAVALADPVASPKRVKAPHAIEATAESERAATTPEAPPAEVADASTKPEPPGRFRTPPMAVLALARTDTPETIEPPAIAPTQPIELDAQSAPPASHRALPSKINNAASKTIDLGDPSDGLAEVLGVGVALRTDPIASAGKGPRTAALSPAARTPTAESPGNVRRDEGATDLAALPSARGGCLVPPSVTLQVRPAGQTDVIVSAPCQGGAVAELVYAGLRLALPLDENGAGDITALGFEVTAEAEIRFGDGETLDFTLPFAGTDRMERVALVWEAPVALSLQALEFGAAAGEAGNVRPGNPRDYGAVRRQGGGFLVSYAPVGKVGQNVQVYTHWLRRGGRSGLIEMMVGVPLEGASAAACREIAALRPNFRVISASRGRLGREKLRRLGKLDCRSSAGLQDYLIPEAVDDVIVSKR